MFTLISASFVVWLILVACDGSNGNGTPTAPAATATQPVGTPTAPGETPAAASPTTGPGDAVELPPLNLRQVASGFTRPTYVTHAGDGSGRLFVLEKPGRILIVQDGSVLSTPFLNITNVVHDGGNEQGLLGLAFHPDFANNGRFFVAYTTTDTNSVAEYRVTGSDPNVADPSSARVLMAIPDQYSNHNGGMLAFGPDGYLYIATGDGGSSGDPLDSGQSLDTLLGKILRIDVDSGDPYGIPDDNPFVGQAGAKGEIWAYGLRNPWRFSFDRETGDLWIADVGQNRLEEINFQPASSGGGENYGWRIMEGTSCFRPQTGCDPSGLVLPIFEYGHNQGCSVTGGYVYRGSAVAGLRGTYLFTDYCSGNLWATQRTGTGFETERVGSIIGGISSFGEDEDGELYILNDHGGALFRVVAE